MDFFSVQAGLVQQLWLLRKAVGAKWMPGMTLLLLLVLPAAALAEESLLWELGGRGGMNATGSDESYRAAELYLLRDLPWGVETVLGPVLTRLDLGGGYLEDAGEDKGGWLAGGGDLVWFPVNGPVELEVGFRPAWLTDHHYGDDDYGGDLQFLSHAGIALCLPRFTLSYRYLHMSNAGLYSENDGLNLHLFGLGARF